jgi:hypothetical protein
MPDYLHWRLPGPATSVSHDRTKPMLEFFAYLFTFVSPRLRQLLSTTSLCGNQRY